MSVPRKEVSRKRDREVIFFRRDVNKSQQFTSKGSAEMVAELR